MATVKLQGIVAKNLRGKTDWARLKQMTDTEIKAAVAADPAMRVIDDSRLFKFKKNNTK